MGHTQAEALRSMRAAADAGAVDLLLARPETACYATPRTCARAPSPGYPRPV